MSNQGFHWYLIIHIIFILPGGGDASTDARPTWRGDQPVRLEWRRRGLHPIISIIDHQEYYPRVESCWATQTATVCRWRPTEVSPMPRELSPMSTPSMNVEAAKLETSMTPPSALEPHPGSSFLHFTFGKTNVIPFQNLWLWPNLLGWFLTWDVWQVVLLFIIISLECYWNKVKNHAM